MLFALLNHLALALLTHFWNLQLFGCSSCNRSANFFKWRALFRPL
jgi:Uri superfamily endonuclease